MELRQVKLDYPCVGVMLLDVLLQKSMQSTTSKAL